MAERAPGWVVPAMRAGASARGIVYIVVGVLAAFAAWTGGNAEGTTGALEELRGRAWGVALLWVVAVGLLGYAVWRWIDGWMDLEKHGTGAKGIVARTGLFVSGAIHFGLALYAARLAIGWGGGSGGGDGAQRWTAWLLSQPYGRWLVMAAGLATIGAGIYYGWKGLSEKYKEDLRASRTAERLAPLCKAGLAAHGIVIGIVGVFLLWAGWTSDPSEAGGLGDAFETVRQAAYGRWLLFALAAGMVFFAVFCFIEAAYRIVPARAGDDVASIATRARRRAEAAASR